MEHRRETTVSWIDCRNTEPRSAAVLLQVLIVFSLLSVTNTCVHCLLVRLERTGYVINDQHVCITLLESTNNNTIRFGRISFCWLIYSSNIENVINDTKCTMHRTLVSICSAWNNCSEHVGREGCTFDDLLVQVLQYSSWIQFKSYDVIQRYKEATDSLRHSCNNIEPGTNTRQGRIMVPPGHEAWKRLRASHRLYLQLLTLF